MDELIIRRNDNGAEPMSHDRKEGRYDDIPRWLTWGMTFVNRVGFPIAVAVYLGYMQISAIPRLIEALSKVEQAVHDNTEVLRGWNRQ